MYARAAPRTVLLGGLGDAPRILGGRACHVEQHNYGIGVQLPEGRHFLATLQFFQFGADARRNRNQPNQVRATSARGVFSSRKDAP